MAMLVLSRWEQIIYWLKLDGLFDSLAVAFLGGPIGLLLLAVPILFVFGLVALAVGYSVVRFLKWAASVDLSKH